MDKMLELVNRLNEYRDAYYNRNENLISDKEYDALFDELAGLEKKTGIVYANSPTATVGYAVVSKLQKVAHNHPLLSLGKTTDMAEFCDYFEGKPMNLMAKMDGLTASIVYRDGVLVSAESRGNGEIGEDITHTARTFAALPQRIPFRGELIVDGECIIDYPTFRRIIQREQTEYKNPRNLVSGTVRQLDSRVAARREVHFIAWKLYRAAEVSGQPLPGLDTYSAAFAFLREQGFEVVPNVRVPNDYPDEESRRADLEAVMEDLQQTCAARGYPIDGLVGSFEDVAYGLSLGSTGHHPKHSLAFKFYQDRNETVLRDIEWSTNRTGQVNPVAVFDPVEIDGTTVSRASLNNVSIIRELELGLGDTITVIKANQIIPMVTDNLTRSASYVFPTRCGSCGSTLELRNDNGREMLYCVNPACPAIRLDQITYFVSRDAMNIMGLSQERLKMLIDRGFVGDFADIYHQRGQSAFRHRGKPQLPPCQCAHRHRQSQHRQEQCQTAGGAVLRRGQPPGALPDPGAGGLRLDGAGRLRRDHERRHQPLRPGKRGAHPPADPQFAHRGRSAEDAGSRRPGRKILLHHGKAPALC